MAIEVGGGEGRIDDAVPEIAHRVDPGTDGLRLGTLGRSPVDGYHGSPTIRESGAKRPATDTGHLLAQLGPRPESQPQALVQGISDYSRVRHDVQRGTIHATIRSATYLFHRGTYRAVVR